jgi:hypothetical protein
MEEESKIFGQAPNWQSRVNEVKNCKCREGSRLWVGSLRKTEIFLRAFHFLSASFKKILDFFQVKFRVPGSFLDFF